MMLFLVASQHRLDEFLAWFALVGVPLDAADAQE